MYIFTYFTRYIICNPHRVCLLMKQNIVVGIASRLGADHPGLVVWLPVLQNVRTGSRPTEPPSQWTRGAFSSRVMRPECEADQ